VCRDHQPSDSADQVRYRESSLLDDLAFSIAKDWIVIDPDERRLSCRARCKYPGHQYRCDEHHDITSASSGRRLIVAHWRPLLR
jgi:hypothetical protein